METKASLQYFRKVSQATNGAEELEGTYLRRAVVNTSAYFPTEAAANMAYLAMTSNQEAWVTKASNFHFLIRQKCRAGMLRGNS